MLDQGYSLSVLARPFQLSLAVFSYTEDIMLGIPQHTRILHHSLPLPIYICRTLPLAIEHEFNASLARDTHVG